MLLEVGAHDRWSLLNFEFEMGQLIFEFEFKMVSCKVFNFIRQFLVSLATVETSEMVEDITQLPNYFVIGQGLTFTTSSPIDPTTQIFYGRKTIYN